MQIVISAFIHSREVWFKLMILLLFSQKGTHLEKIESNLPLQVRPGLLSTCNLYKLCIYIHFFLPFFYSFHSFILRLDQITLDFGIQLRANTFREKFNLNHAIANWMNDRKNERMIETGSRRSLSFENFPGKKWSVSLLIFPKYRDCIKHSKR